MRKIVIAVFIVVLASGLAFIFRDDFRSFLALLQAQYASCDQPIAYTVAAYDARFGISKDDFAGAIREAEQVWEKPVSKELFVPEPEGDLKINLIYDFRQEATIKLRALGIAVSDDKVSYDALRVKYDALQEDYRRKKTLLESQAAAFQEHQDVYDKEVAYWNDRGGAPPKEFNRLSAQKVSLENELRLVRESQTMLNNLIDNINALVVVLNRLAASLNLGVVQFNEIGKERGREFEEAIYQSGHDGQEIDVYQFDDRRKLVRVLAHELGHALGLEHSSNPKAIMYRLNQGINERLTLDDLAALKTLCGI